MRVLISLTAPAWVVRNMIILDLGILVIGWVLGIAIMRQAERSVAMWEDGVEQYARKQKEYARERDTEGTEKELPF